SRGGSRRARSRASAPSRDLGEDGRARTSNAGKKRSTPHVDERTTRAATRAPARFSQAGGSFEVAQGLSVRGWDEWLSMFQDLLSRSPGFVRSPCAERSGEGEDGKEKSEGEKTDRRRDETQDDGLDQAHGLIDLSL